MQLQGRANRSFWNCLLVVFCKDWHFIDLLHTARTLGSESRIIWVRKALILCAGLGIGAHVQRFRANIQIFHISYALIAPIHHGQSTTEHFGFSTECLTIILNGSLLLELQLTNKISRVRIVSSVHGFLNKG
ncbi:unnamed protein product [Phytomonas sp. EM1]|nr:unnamed protein product [Phytomonas sp. EM1]|eukprot:CCW59950.1 unnamed protein product [Phytomonas sp. isolate EM1]